MKMRFVIGFEQKVNRKFCCTHPNTVLFTYKATVYNTHI